jgi:hypothetical protein
VANVCGQTVDPIPMHTLSHHTMYIIAIKGESIWKYYYMLRTKQNAF